ncbi:cytochrome P450 [Xanthovirga aplysinae]|uniref:cytochrome P450 n=1 Tax=Xanthovirga aplysinae TaxID=2529853 RepID=UPI0012BC79A6|nr:cytochrome P450 [Xanthovirga aplysinae]MTI33176.1 cytochrome P450 [Xanthovirga aplysinae]
MTYIQMINYNLPNGPSFFTTIFEGREKLEMSEKWFKKEFEKFGDTFSVPLNLTEKAIITQDKGFIRYLLEENSQNYAKSNHTVKHFGKYIGKNLLTSNGHFWLQQRRLLQPAFHLNNLKGIYTNLQQSIDNYLDDFPTGRSIDIYPFMHHMTFHLLTKILFNSPVTEKTLKEMDSNFDKVLKFMVKDIRQPYTVWWRKLRGQSGACQLRVKKIRAVLQEIINQRRSEKTSYNDLLDIMIEAPFDEKKQPMNDEQIIDELMIFFFAGHTTTANALSWTIYLLAKHPKFLFHLKSLTENINLEECIHHPYLLAVLKESLRLYPPIRGVDRAALEDDSYQEFSYPKGTMIIIFLYGLHRNPKFWKQPNTFNPNRFLKENNKQFPLKAFFPFGGGPRSCIGYNFAMAEMTIFLKTFIHRFGINTTAQIPKMVPQVTIRPDKIVLDINIRQTFDFYNKTTIPHVA